MNKIKEYQTLIIDKLEQLKSYNKFISYLKNYWFNHNRYDYNYSDVISNYYKNKNLIDRMYLTNNIVESLHSKINLYLPKHKSTKYNFINTLENIIFNDSFKIENLKRFDFKTKALMLLIEKENLNTDIKWINYKTFIYYIKSVKDSINNNIVFKEINDYKDDHKNITYINYKYKGIKNLTNTCYMNSILQVLFHIKQFRDAIINIKLRKK